MPRRASDYTREQWRINKNAYNREYYWRNRTYILRYKKNKRDNLIFYQKYVIPEMPFIF